MHIARIMGRPRGVVPHKAPGQLLVPVWHCVLTDSLATWRTYLETCHLPAVPNPSTALATGLQEGSDLQLTLMYSNWDTTGLQAPAPAQPGPAPLPAAKVGSSL